MGDDHDCLSQKPLWVERAETISVASRFIPRKPGKGELTAHGELYRVPTKSSNPLYAEMECKALLWMQIVEVKDHTFLP